MTGSTPLAPGSRLEGTLRNLASLTIDVTGACLSGAPVGYTLTADGSTRLTLSDGRTATLDGACWW